MMHVLLAVAAFAAPAQPPEPIGYGWALLKMMLALVVVCVVAYLLLRYGLRRLAAPQLAGRNMRPIERCPLTAGRSLWLVEVAGRYLIIGEADGGITNLGEVAKGDLKLEATNASRSFADLLKRRVTNKRGEGDAA